MTTWQEANPNICCACGETMNGGRDDDGNLKPADPAAPPICNDCYTTLFEDDDD